MNLENTEFKREQKSLTKKEFEKLSITQRFFNRKQVNDSKKKKKSVKNNGGRITN